MARSRQSGATPDSATASLDVSQIVWLRKRLGRARLAIKVAALHAAVVFPPLVFRLAPSLSDAVQVLLALALAVLIAWAGFRLASAFARGSLVAAWIVALALVPYAVYTVRVVLRFVAGLPETIDAGVWVSQALWIGSAYFIGRGLLAARSVFASQSSPAARLLTAVARVWDSSEKIDRPQAFANKRRAAMYWFLFLIPCVWLAFGVLGAATALNRSPEPIDPDEELGRQIFQLFLAVPVWLLFAFLYRRARRAALANATDLRRKHDRPFVLYLRSFGDDRIKMRGRATNGRMWLEAAPKVSFEEVVVDHLFRYGPVLALGQPDERLAPLGAARDYVVHRDWQPTIDELMDQALAVTIVIGRTEGLVWELNRLLEERLTGKLIMLVPPVEEPEVHERWMFLRDAFAATHPAVAAYAIDSTRTRAILISTDGAPLAITAEDHDDWTYEVVLDASAALVIGGVQSHALAEAQTLVGPVLPGVATARTDRVGRAVNGAILATGIGFAVGMAGVLGSLPAQPPQPQVLLATSLSTLFLLASAWLATARWLAQVSWRERALTNGVMLLQIPPAFVFASESLAVLPLLLGLLFGVYFAYRRDRLKWVTKSSHAAKDERTLA